MLDEQTLDWLVEGVAETVNMDDPSSAHATPEVYKAANAFQNDLAKALDEYNAAHGLDYDGVEIVENENGGYLVFMTLEGHGVGIWDGRWDHLYTQDQIEELQEFLEKKVGHYASGTGEGILGEAMMDAAFETGGEVLPEDQWG